MKSIIMLPILATSMIHFSSKGWENVLFELYLDIGPLESAQSFPVHAKHDSKQNACKSNDSGLKHTSQGNLRSGPSSPLGPRGTGAEFVGKAGQIPRQSLTDQEEKKGLIAGCSQEITISPPDTSLHYTSQQQAGSGHTQQQKERLQAN